MPKSRALHPSIQPAQPPANRGSQFPNQETMVDGQISSLNIDNPWKAGPRAAALLSRISAIVLDAKASERYSREIEPYLSPKQKAVVEKMIFANPPLSILEAIPTVPHSNSSAIRYNMLHSILKKLERWQKGERISRECEHARPTKFLDSARIAIEGRMASGETLEEIKRSLKSSRTESMVIDLCVLPSERQMHKQVAEEIGVSIAAVTAALRTLSYKLRGLSPRENYFAKYRGMSDDEIKQAIASSGARTTAELTARNYGLSFIAKERGIADQVFPNKKGKGLHEIKVSLKKRLEKDPLETILSELGPLEREIVLKRVLPDNPSSRLGISKSHGVTSSELYELEQRLKTKLWDARMAMVSAKGKTANELGKERLQNLRAGLDEKELAVLDRRILNPEPETLDSLGQSFSVSREMARQIEKKLLRKISVFSEHGNVAFRRKTCMTEKLKELRKNAGAMEEKKLKEFRNCLTRLELAILEKRGLSAFPETRASIARSFSVSTTAIVYAEEKLLRKLTAFSEKGEILSEETLVDIRQPNAQNGIHPRRYRVHSARTSSKLNELRRMAELVGEDRLKEFRSYLNWLEREILDRRGINVPPEIRPLIANRLSVSPKTIVRHEKKLLARLTAFSEKGELPSE